ncbi:MAG: PHB depolymerase family esterase [Deltaproteobacteria bacterium]
MLARRLARLAVSAAIIALLAWLGDRWQARRLPGSVTRTFEYAGGERTYTLHPGSATSKTSLVLLLHGLGGYGEGMERRTRFDAAAERAGAVVAYPDAIAAQWNDGWWSSTSDDVGFLRALADALVDEFGIDRRRVYVAGFSNGAGMAHRLACETDRFAAIAAVSGDMFTSVALSCSNGKPVSVMVLHGTDDPVVPYGVPLTRTMTHWLTHDECAEPGETLQLPDVDPSDGTRVSMQAHARCLAGTEVALYTITGGGHTWPGEDFQWLRFRRPGNISRDFDAGQTILDFFLRHPQP